MIEFPKWGGGHSVGTFERFCLVLFSVCVCASFLGVLGHEAGGPPFVDEFQGKPTMRSQGFPPCPQTLQFQAYGPFWNLLEFPRRVAKRKP